MSAKGARLESHASTAASGTGQTDQGRFSRTQIDRVAGLYVTGGIDSTGKTGTLSAIAGRDLTLTAAEVVNAGSGPTTLAATNDLTLGTVMLSCNRLFPPSLEAGGL